MTSWVCAAWLTCLDKWYWSYWTMSATFPSAHISDVSWRNKRSGQRYVPSWVSSLGSHLIIYLFSQSFLTYGNLILSQMKELLWTAARSPKMTKCMWEDTCYITFLATDRLLHSLQERRLIAFEFVPDNPRSLKHLCRLEIRKHMTVKKLFNIILMDSFPPMIRNYLLYKEYGLTWSAFKVSCFWLFYLIYLFQTKRSYTIVQTQTHLIIINKTSTYLYI